MADQYLPWATGLRIRLSQGNLSPCGWSHAPASCNSIGAYTQYGWDFELPYGADVHAPFAGKVILARTGCASTPRYSASWGCNDGYGNTVTIEMLPNGSCARFEHLSRVNVRPGQLVSGYDVIGAVGNAGNSSGTHLHYQREICFGRSQGISLPSSFIEAGVPRTGQWVTSANHPSGVVQPGYYVIGPASGLDVHSAANSSSGVVGHLGPRVTVSVLCQTKGNTVGNSTIWDGIAAGQYVPDYYISTPGDGAFTPGIPACGNPTPTPAPAPTPTPTPGPTPANPGPPFANGAYDTSFEHTGYWATLNGGTQQNDVCGDGTAYSGSCFLDVSASASPYNSFVQDISYAPVPGQCLTLSAWLRSRSAASYTGVLAIWALNQVHDQSSSTNFTVGRQWTRVIVTMKVPYPISGPAWTKLRGQLYMNSPHQLLDWDLTQWFGPYSC